jgi:formylglycine-generating enzyme required for sulfatase activity
MTDPEDFALIPSGDLEMGDCLHDEPHDKRGTHIAHVSTFYMAKNMVTYSLWEKVYKWAISQGYEFESDGLAYGADHPVHSIHWYDALKWCNAKSEMEGLTPAYYTDDGRKAIYRRGRSDLKSGMVAWYADGYRLPTETEWEYAARGGLTGKRFPWGDTVTYDQANYYSSKKEDEKVEYDLCTVAGPHPLYRDRMSPVASFPPNGYGLYDMAGNCYQWVWDYFSESPVEGYTIDPRGPESGNTRISRGGDWRHGAVQIRVFYRRMSHPLDGLGHIGLRPVIGSVKP